MVDQRESFLRKNFVSKKYIEDLVEFVEKTPFSKKTLFPNILRKLLPTERNGVRRCYYNGEDSIFEELSRSLSLTSFEIELDYKKGVARDLAIVITKFLICFPENCHVTQNDTPVYKKILIAGFNAAQNVVKEMFTKDVAFVGGKSRERVNKIDIEIFETAKTVHYLIEIVTETLITLSGIELTPAEISQIIAEVSTEIEEPPAVFEKIRNAIQTGSSVSLYTTRYNWKPSPGVYGVVGYRFIASELRLKEDRRGKGDSKGERNKGRVYMKETTRSNINCLDIPIATPTHIVDTNKLRDRLDWIQKNFKKTSKANNYQ